LRPEAALATHLLVEAGELRQRHPHGLKERVGGIHGSGAGIKGKQLAGDVHDPLRDDATPEEGGGGTGAVLPLAAGPLPDLASGVATAASCCC